MAKQTGVPNQNRHLFLRNKFTFSIIYSLNWESLKWPYRGCLLIQTRCSNSKTKTIAECLRF